MSRYQTTQVSDAWKAIGSDIFTLCKALRHTPTWQQAQLYEAVQRKTPRIAIKAGMGPGKSCGSAVVAIFRCLQAEGAMTVVTAPTMRQCNDVFMGEVRRHLKNAYSFVRDFIKTTKTRVVLGGNHDWCVRTATAKKGENIFGNHEKNMTIICEEASGISPLIMNALKGTVSNPNSLILQIGNPSSRSCAFFDCFHSLRHLWDCYTWNAEETPETEWFTRQRNRDLEEEFGRDSDMYRIAVLGEFPKSDPDTVISEEWLQEASQKGRLVEAARCLREGGKPPARQMGMDFARFGGDENTIYRRSGNAVVQWGCFPHTDPNDVVDTAFSWQKKAGWTDRETWYAADAGGIGQGLMGNFHRANKNIYEFHTSARSSNARKYANQMTEAWFHLAHILKNKPCCIPEDKILFKQLTTRRYFINKNAQLILEDKESYKKRGFDSPDRAEGLVMSFFDRCSVESNVSSKHTGTHKVGMEVQ